MAVPTDQAVTSWKGRRTTAANNFQLTVDKVDPLINGRPDLAIQDIEQLLCELEVKFATYEKAYDKLVGNATDEQMAREGYGNLIAMEHEDLLKKLEDSDLKLKLKRRALDRAAENADREDLRSRHAQETLANLKHPEPTQCPCQSEAAAGRGLCPSRRQSRPCWNLP